MSQIPSEAELSRLPRTESFIDNRWVAGGAGRRIGVFDPARDERVADVHDGGAGHAARAVDAAGMAFGSWSATPGSERAAHLRQLSALVMRERERLARLMTREQGKALKESRGEVAYAASFLSYSAGEAERLGGEVLASSARDKRMLVLRQAAGVSAAVTPWNFPLAMITRKVGPALAAGCTMVVKPAEQTPLTAMALAELVEESGLPGGVVNFVNGEPGAIVDAWLSDERVRVLSFTGSTEVGRELIGKSAERVTRLGLELGGHAPVIVFEDADLERAADGVIASKFRNAGQTCICANRLLVQRSVRERFVELVRERAEGLVVGPGDREGVDVGPLIDDAAMEKVERHVAQAVEGGARVVTGGERVRVGEGFADRFYRPTVLEDVSIDAVCMREETFGPVLPVVAFDTELEAIALANASEYGLAAYFFTRDASRVMRVAEALDYGIVGANDALPSAAQAPFGGVKRSGYGREGGRWGVEEFLSVKYVSWGL